MCTLEREREYDIDAVAVMSCDMNNIYTAFCSPSVNIPWHSVRVRTLYPTGKIIAPIQYRSKL
jgi:hypothetical protein